MAKFTSQNRQTVLDRIVAIAKADSRVTGGALVGSFATGQEDEWSDIDITFGIQSGFTPKEFLDEWTGFLQEEFDIVHWFDVPHRSAIYRVMLFANGLELDLSVVPEAEFRAMAPGFDLLFGKGLPFQKSARPSNQALFGWGWHHVLHAHAAIQRGRLWQAEFMISRLRDVLISIKCSRHGLPAEHARGADLLPGQEIQQLLTTLITKLEGRELLNKLQLVAAIYLDEVRRDDKVLADRLEGILWEMLEL